jgi:hypothetical protein
MHLNALACTKKQSVNSEPLKSAAHLIESENESSVLIPFKITQPLSKDERLKPMVKKYKNSQAFLYFKERPDPAITKNFYFLNLRAKTKTLQSSVGSANLPNLKEGFLSVIKNFNALFYLPNKSEEKQSVRAYSHKNKHGH